MERAEKPCWKTFITSFPKVILDGIEKQLTEQGYSDFTYLKRGVEGELIKAYSEVDAKLVQINLLWKNKIDHQTVKGEYEKLINLKDTKYIIKYLRALYLEDYFIYAVISEYYNTNIQDEMQDLKARGTWYDDDAASAIIVNLCSIVQELHSNGITHHFIEPQNIVKSEDGAFKITDLSLSIALNTNRQAAISFIKNNLRYASTELDQLEESKIINLTQKSDVFSMSLIFLEVLGFPLDDIIIKQIQNGHFSEKQSIDGFRFKNLQKLLIEQFFNPSQEKRVESYEMIYKLLPNLPFFNPQSKTLEKINEQLQEMVDIDSFLNMQTIPYRQNLKLYSKLAQIEILKSLPKTSEETIIAAKEEASKCLYNVGLKKQCIDMRVELLKYYKQKQPDNLAKISEINLNISFAYMKMLDYKNSLLYCGEAFQQTNQIYKGDSEQLTKCLYILSWCYFGQKQYDQAVEFGLKSLQMKRNIFPAGDLEIASSVSSMGTFYDCQKKFDLGLQYKLESQEMRQKQLNSGNKKAIAHLIYSNLALAASFKQLKQYQASIDYYFKSVELKKQYYGYYHHEVVDSLNRIKNVYITMKNTEESNRIQQQIQSIQSHCSYKASS